MTFVFDILTVSFQSSQYSPNTLSANCRSSFEFPNITVSSAKSKTMIFMNTYTFSSIVSQGFPGTLFASRYSLRSFKYMENRRGDRFSPCLTPV